MSSLHLPFDTFKTDLTDIANIAEGAGGSTDRMNEILSILGRTLAITGQMGAIPALYLRRLEVLIPGVTEALAKFTGQPIAAFQNLSRGIRLPLKEVEGFIKTLGEGQYSGALEAQANTLTGLFGSIQAQATSMIDSILGVSSSGKTANNSVFSIIQGYMKEFFGYLEAHKGQIETWFKTELQIFLDYIIAHKTDIENFFKNINKELSDFGNWVSANKQTIETMVNLINGLGTLGSNLNLLNNKSALSAGESSMWQNAQTALGINPYSVNNSRTNTINMHNTINNGTDTNNMLAEMMYKLNHR